jgi:hypothetical protein
MEVLMGYRAGRNVTTDNMSRTRRYFKRNSKKYNRMVSGHATVRYL